MKLTVEKSDTNKLFELSIEDGNEKETHEVDGFQALMTIGNFMTSRLQEEWEEQQDNED